MEQNETIFDGSHKMTQNGGEVLLIHQRVMGLELRMWGDSDLVKVVGMCRVQRIGKMHVILYLERLVVMEWNIIRLYLPN